MNWNLRKRYGEIFVTSLPDGLDVPWKPLSFGDFIYFTEIIQEGRVPLSLLHEEIFCKCVSDSYLVDTLDELRAGVITTVAEDILNVSGPYQPDLFNQDMDNARHRASLYIHQISTLVCQAFPAYKPEDILAMNYETLLLRLAQTEEILMKAKLLTEPISMFDAKLGPVKKGRSAVPDEILKAWERSGKNPSDIKPEEEKPRRMKEAWEKVNKVALPKDMDTKPKSINPDSPLLKKHGKIDFGKDNKELGISGGVSGWDKKDAPIIQHKMIENARKIYPHLFNKQQEREQEKK